jgi:predicted ester cyclase
VRPYMEMKESERREMSEENKAKVRRLLEGFFSPEAGSIVDDVVSPDLVDHSPMPDQRPGVEGLKEIIVVMRNAFPDGKITVDDLIAEGDRVVARWTLRGTHRGEFMGIAATGKQVSMSGIEIDRFAGDKAVEHWEQADIMSLMQQLGAIPGPG